MHGGLICITLRLYKKLLDIKSLDFNSLEVNSYLKDKGKCPFSVKWGMADIVDSPLNLSQYMDFLFKKKQVGSRQRQVAFFTY